MRQLALLCLIKAMMLKALLDRAHVADPAHSARLFEDGDPAEPDLAARAALTTHVASDPAATRWAQRVRASSAQLARATADAAVDTVTAVLASGRDLPAILCTGANNGTDADPSPLAADLASDATFRTRVLCAIGDRLMLDHEPIAKWAAAAAACRLGEARTTSFPPAGQKQTLTSIVP
ncbi:hypothetical protein GGF32_008849 [Allomyces javanicus]|nr:hypothetical protein GGF32_008849 [Allomyces javanicus]